MDSHCTLPSFPKRSGNEANCTPDGDDIQFVKCTGKVKKGDMGKVIEVI